MPTARPMLTFLLGSALTVLPAIAQPNLAVSPKRIVFDGSTRSAVVSLLNQGDEAATFRVGFHQIRMAPDGAMLEIERAAPGERFADTMIRFSPRRVVLEPGDRQVVRLMLRKPAALASGEYRSHLRFQVVPPDAGQGLDDDTAADALSVALRPIFGLSIPVIVRHGDLTADASIDGLHLDRRTDPEAAVLTLELGRTGERSLYGDLIATFTPDGGEPRRVGRARGLAVYAPYPSRHLRWPLEWPSDLAADAGTLDVTFRSQPKDGDEILATAELALR